MKIPVEFESIRPFSDEEIPQVITNIINDKDFRKAVKTGIKWRPFWAIRLAVNRFKSCHEIQTKLCNPYLKKLLDKYSDGLSFNFDALKNIEENCLYISNHRDIILDSAFLSLILMENNKRSVEIAIGDNLLIRPWIENFVRLNRSFIVKRSLPPLELLESSKTLSKYINFVINEKKNPIWMAQREGRAKDSNDRTQIGVLKMLAMSGDGDIIDRLINLNIVPLSISYEYDPCDYLKAQEFQEKRDNPDFIKTPEDDLLNMSTGLLGYKGKIHYHATEPINNALLKLDRNQPRNRLLSQIAEIIDSNIFAGYKLYPNNYIAYNMLHSDDLQQRACYTISDKEKFKEYLEKQLMKVTIENPDWNFLRKKILEMYANPLVNRQLIGIYGIK
ncbi:MAG TPA: 1-acyl-sn-glycerol-3-phosphate acyltransferase [Bacteroidaceae bacterium]|nr:1-acyl-sn-glycerol-3-phosphate acyltransferase [Bacteroidaceae bacterium]